MAKVDALDYRKIGRIVWRNFAYMKGKRVLLIISSMLALGKLVLSFVIPWLYQVLIGLVEANTPARDMMLRVAMPFALLLAIAPLVSLAGYWQKVSAHHALANMHRHAFGHAMRLPLSALEANRTDRLMRATDNVQGAMSMFSGYTVTLVFEFVIFFGGALALLLAHDWRYACIGVAVSLLMFYMSSAFNARLRVLEHNAMRSDSKAAALLVELIENLQVVKLYQMEPRLGKRFEQAAWTSYAQRQKYKVLRGITDGAMDFTSYSIQAAAIMLGVTALGGGADFAQLVYVTGLLSVLLSGMRELGFAIIFIQRAIASSERVYELMAEPQAADRADDAVPDKAADTAIAFEGVHFAYVPGQPVIDGLTVRIPAGKTTAIVGPSGGGKSSMFKLIEGLYAPDSGEIRILGAPISRMRNGTIHGCFAYIPQEAGLFDGTIAENVRLGSPGCRHEDILAALRAAALDLDELPQREHTPVGENGGKLSGGQRQRVAIARALVRGAPIYLLDEATAALDVHTERAIQATFAGALAGKTVVCVAHRLSTIVGADLILYVEGGRVLETGTHEELLALGGGYAQLYAANA